MDKLPGAAPVKGGRQEGAESTAGSAQGGTGGRKVSAAAGEGQPPPLRESREPTGAPQAKSRSEQIRSRSSKVIVPPQGPQLSSLAAPARRQPATESASTPKSTQTGTKKKMSGKPSQEEVAAKRAAKKAGTVTRVPKKSKADAPGKPHVPKLEKGAADPGKTFRAVAEGNFRQLDPVTGDASCQMRVPFMLDAMDILAASDPKPASLTAGFDSAYGPDFNRLPPDVGSRKGSLPKLGSMAEHYFSMFYPLSVIRCRADDSLRFLIDEEPDGSTYSYGEVNRWKSATAQYSVDYMRKLAGVQAVETADRAPITGQISRLLEDASIELNKAGYRQPVLPVFTAQYFLAQNEHLHGRPLVLALTRLGNDDEGRQYHFGTSVYMYKPNRTDDVSEKKFELVRAAPEPDDAKRGVTVVHAFNMFALDPAERERYEASAGFSGDERFFNSPENEEFESGFGQCDFNHLLRMWGAAHPPAPPASVAQGFKPGETRDYVETKHGANRSGRAVPEYTLVGQASLFGGQEANLADEYFAYKKMADKYGVTGVRYATEAGASRKSYYVGPPGRVGEDAPLSEWTTMTDATFSDVASASGARGQRDRITYAPKLFRRVSQPVPFSAVHVFVSSYDEEQKHAERLNTEFPRDRTIARDIELELISGSLYEKSGKKKGQPTRRDTAFWAVGETIDREHRSSVQFPDSKTELGYETAMAPEDRRAMAGKITEIARTLRAVGDIVTEVVEAAFEAVDSR